MGSADIRSAMNWVSREKSELEHLRTKLSGKTITNKLSVTRNTSGMDGQKYEQQHEEVEEAFTTFSGEVKSVKGKAMKALNSKIGELNHKLEDLETQYHAALAAEEAQRQAKAAARRAAAEERARRQAASK